MRSFLHRETGSVDTKRCPSERNLALKMMLYAFVVVSAGGAPSEILADDATVPSEQIVVPCVGAYPEGGWGTRGPIGDEREAHCPDGWAYMTGVRVGGVRAGPAQVDLKGLCCPLPSGALLPEKVMVTERCPDGFVATGVSYDTSSAPEGAGWESFTHRMECTKLDSERFVLGPPTEGWEVSVDEPFFANLMGRLLGRDPKNIAWSRLPASIRMGVNRAGMLRWDDTSCIGNPPGSLVVAKHGKGCAQFHFSQLLDRRTGEAVRVLPECAGIPDPLASEPHCETVSENGSGGPAGGE